MPLPFVLSYRRVKLPSREPSPNLTEYAASSCHGRASLVPVVSVLVEPEPTLAGALPVPSFTPPTFLQIPENLISTRVIFQVSGYTNIDDELALFDAAEAPEPGNMLLMGTALALGLLGRKRMRQQATRGIRKAARGR